MLKADPFSRTETKEQVPGSILNSDTGIKQKGEHEQVLCLIYNCS